MKRYWSIQKAKREFIQLVDEALAQGPQVIAKKGVETAVVLSWVEYRRLQLRQKKLSEFFRESPLVGVDLQLTRDRS